jgi:hypothetical protein
MSTLFSDFVYLSLLLLILLLFYFQGKLLFCHPPPGIAEKDFQKPPYAEEKVFDVPVSHGATQVP